MQIGTDTNLQIEKFLGKKGHHHPAMGPVSNSVPPPAHTPTQTQTSKHTLVER